MSDKPIKPWISENKTEPKSSISTTIESNHSVKTKDNSTKNSKAKLKMKGTCFQKQTENKSNPSNSKAQNLNEPETPMASLSGTKPRSRIISTPYHSAENCSKCRFDRLETSSYWLAQIKLAESGCRHFVSASFFRLACESEAEPMRNLRNELKRYLVRHEHLRKETEWKEVSLAYGLSLFKDENRNAESNNLAVMETAAVINSSSINDLEQDQQKIEGA